MECIVAKRCVLEQKLLLTAYRKFYMRNRLAVSALEFFKMLCAIKNTFYLLTYLLTKMNDLDLCLEVSYCHLNHCVTFAIEYLGNR